MTAGLAAFYGLPAPGGSAAARVMLNPGQRRGILTHASFLSAHSDDEPEQIRTPIVRGEYLSSKVACLEPPPPGPTDQALAASFKVDPMLTMRDNLGAINKLGSSCSACHSLFAPYGVAPVRAARECSRDCSRGKSSQHWDHFRAPVCRHSVRRRPRMTASWISPAIWYRSRR